MEYLATYGLFFAKMLTVFFFLALFVVIVSAAAHKGRKDDRGQLVTRKFNDHYKLSHDELLHSTMDAAAFKKYMKAKKKEGKQKKNRVEEHPKLFVLDFHGDIRATAVKSLREEVSAVLSVATEKDEVLVRLESAGGLVHSYGLAASQLARVGSRGISLTVAVDKVAASGGYMMACTADTIISAPFAVIGSIGVMAQLPNIHNLLKKNDVDIELHTAGEYKRTLTVLGENTEKGRDKFKQDIQETHELFKEFVSTQRETVDIEAVATGEIWYGTKALEKQLVDRIQTSDEYLIDKVDSFDVIEVKYESRKNLAARLGVAAESAVSQLVSRLWGASFSRFY